MFGIGVDEDIDICLYEDLDVRLEPRHVVYITGESGAGKSCLLKDVRAKALESASFHPIDGLGIESFDDAPLVDCFGSMGLKQIGELLAYVGISEAFVYLRKPKELSDGQRYRFLLAQMIHAAKRLQESEAARTPVIIIDEFLAFLDRDTARNVAYQVRRAASKHDLCFVVATTHEDIKDDLQPNQTVTLRLNLPPEIKHTALPAL